MNITREPHPNSTASPLRQAPASWASATRDVPARRDVYLDYAAATPMDPAVLEAMLPYLTDRFYNPSAPYAAARAVRADYEAARATLARLIGARPACVTITAGATEANNLAFAWLAPDAHVVTLATEHESVLSCARVRECTLVGVGHDGRVDPAQVGRAIRPDTELVSLSLANGEVGFVQPVHDVALLVAAERARRLEAGEDRPIWLHVDASQAAAHLSVGVSALGADLMTLSAAKVYGPKQVGLLWAREGVRLSPLVRGGGQEAGLRSGTENVAGAVGFARALELACERRAEEARRLAGLRGLMQRELLRAFPWMLVSGPKKPRWRLPGHLSVAFPGLEARRLVVLLEGLGVSVGTGSACAASRMERSHVLAAMGLTPEQANGSLRLTLGRPTTPDDVRYALDAICSVVRQECARLGVDELMGAPVAGGARYGACGAAATTVTDQTEVPNGERA